MINAIKQHSFTSAILRRINRSVFSARLSIQSRNLNNSSDSAAYDGDGKTTVRVLNVEDPHLNFVNTYSSSGFRLSNNLFVHGSILLFPTNVYSWNIRRGIDINLESLILFDLIVPRTRIIVIGYGDHGEPFNPSLPLLLKKKGISCELLPTPNAVTTYNYLVSDSVHVAGAFVPVKHELVMGTKDIVGLREKHCFDKDERNWVPLAEVDREPLHETMERLKESRQDLGKKKFDE